MKGYDTSSQIVFSPRQDSFSSANHTPNGHVFSSRGPALRAASAEPSAVGPDGPRDSRESLLDTTVVLGGASVDGERPAMRGWQDKAALDRAAQASPQPAPGTEGERRSSLDTVSDRSLISTDDLRRGAFGDSYGPTGTFL